MPDMKFDTSVAVQLLPIVMPAPASLPWANGKAGDCA